MVDRIQSMQQSKEDLNQQVSITNYFKKRFLISLNFIAA
jgi:hypothetical protein